MKVLRIDTLPEAPLDAAAQFHAEWLPRAREASGDVLLVFAAADHSHRAWRLAATQELARELAPQRVNALATDHRSDEDEATAYLAQAGGITGQYLTLAK